MSYIPRLPPANIEDYATFLQEELTNIASNFSIRDFLRLVKLSEEPEKVYEGLLVWAEGWQDEEGFYFYYDGNWHRLGGDVTPFRNTWNKADDLTWETVTYTWETIHGRREENGS